jgi:hypothetical protein
MASGPERARLLVPQVNRLAESTPPSPTRFTRDLSQERLFSSCMTPLRVAAAWEWEYDFVSDDKSQ